MKYWQVALLVLSSFILSFLASACALQAPDKEYIKECILPSDQSATLNARWKVTAVPIALHQGDFSADEARDIAAAVDTWNDFYANSLGISAIDYGGDPNNPRTSSMARPTTLCAQGIISGSQYTGQVVVYKLGSWPYSSLPDAIALTSVCPVPAAGGGLPYAYMAMMEVNYQNFFISGKKLPDLQSILLHEFGHLVGLNHSCERVSKTGVPNCSSSSLNPDYYDAIMFPIFGFDSYGYGEQKRVLTDNDQGRANCLYQDVATK